MTREADKPALAVGMRVRAKHNPEHDPTYNSVVDIGARRQHGGGVGTIADRSAGHGLCYRVQFPLGCAWYEPDELTPEPPGTFAPTSAEIEACPAPAEVAGMPEREAVLELARRYSMSHSEHQALITRCSPETESKLLRRLREAQEELRAMDREKEAAAKEAATARPFSMADAKALLSSARVDVHGAWHIEDVYAAIMKAHRNAFEAGQRHGAALAEQRLKSLRAALRDADDAIDHYREGLHRIMNGEDGLTISAEYSGHDPSEVRAAHAATAPEQKPHRPRIGPWDMDGEDAGVRWDDRGEPVGLFVREGTSWVVEAARPFQRRYRATFATLEVARASVDAVLSTWADLDGQVNAARIDQ